MPLIPCHGHTTHPFRIDNPTSKFGEALRAQVEERLLFFEKGEPPSKNADVIRKVLADIALEEGEDDDVDMDGPALTTLEATAPTPKKDKKKKRKSDDMDVDGDAEDEHSAKKVKLSKEEKKALKKAKKEKAKGDVALAVDVRFVHLSLTL
jgi:nucleolar protein 56